MNPEGITRRKPSRKLSLQTDLVSINCVVIGDEGCGKTCLASRFAFNTFPTEYKPTVSDEFSRVFTTDEGRFVFNISDTSGQHEWTSLRLQQYGNCRVVIVCFAVDSPSSFNSVKSHWLEEVKEICDRRPVSVVIVGTKIDQRRSSEMMVDCISKERGILLAKELGVDYCECSAEVPQGVEGVFETVIRNVMKPSKLHKSSCRVQ